VILAIIETLMVIAGIGLCVGSIVEWIRDWRGYEENEGVLHRDFRASSDVGNSHGDRGSG